MAVAYDFGSAEFDSAVQAAGRKAFSETLAAGLPVFYVDADGANVMERADGGDSKSDGLRARRPEKTTLSFVN